MSAIANQIAVITGASSGIGKAIAFALAAEGATLCLLGRRQDSLDACAQRILETSPHSKTYQLDLTQDAEIEHLKAAIEQDFGQVHILVHSAGVFSMGAIATSPIADLDWQYRVNVRAPYLLTQALLPMLKTCRGQIAFINSSVGLNARATVGQYAATKHALKAIADSLREEVNPYQMRVLSLFPGRTATPLQAVIHQLEGKPYHPERLMQPEDVAAALINALCLPLTGEITDINIRPLAKPHVERG